MPSKAQLRPPFPANLPVINICPDCNNLFSLDEEYTMVFLAVVLTGSTDPDAFEQGKIKSILQKNFLSRKRLEAARDEKILPDGQKEIFWKPEIETLSRTLLKNARGHIMYELGEPMVHDPYSVDFKPLVSMNIDERYAFEFETESGGLWPEVGSRMTQRIIE